MNIIKGQPELDVEFNKVRSAVRHNQTLTSKADTSVNGPPVTMSLENCVRYLDTIQECYWLLNQALRNEPGWRKRVEEHLNMRATVKPLYYSRSQNSYVPVEEMDSTHLYNAIVKQERDASTSLHDAGIPWVKPDDSLQIAKILPGIYWSLRREAAHRKIALPEFFARPDLPDEIRTRQGVAASVEDLRALIYQVLEATREGSGVDDTWMFQARLAIGEPAEINVGCVCYCKHPKYIGEIIGEYVGYGLAIVAISTLRELGIVDDTNLPFPRFDILVVAPITESLSKQPKEPLGSIIAESVATAIDAIVEGRIKPRAEI